MLTKKQYQALKAEFIALLRKVDRPGIEELLEYLGKTDFFMAPARCEHGCSFPGGLLAHTMNVYRTLSEKLTPGNSLAWQGVALDANVTAETIIIVSLLHDIGKTGAFERSQKNVKTYDAEAVKKAKSHEVKQDGAGSYVWIVENGYRYTNESPLGGDGEAAVIMAQRYIQLTDTEIRALRWHAGYGPEAKTSRVSDAFAATPLALALYEADMEATFLLDTNV